MNPANFAALADAIERRTDLVFAMDHHHHCIVGFANKIFDVDFNSEHEWFGLAEQEFTEMCLGLWFSPSKLPQISRGEVVAELRRRVHKYWFDKAYDGLAKQGWKASLLDEMSCAYRSPDDPNCRCAIGHMIDPAQYRTAMDSANWGFRSFAIAGLLPGLTDDQFYNIQELHDLSKGPDDMKSKFDAYRLEHKLT